MSKRVYVAGHRGMVGAAICRQLAGDPTVELISRSRDHLDLLDQAAVQTFFSAQKPDQVYLAAAKVGGIHANNSYPAEFIHQNLVIQTNIIEAAHRVGVSRLLFLGSSCIYPRNTSQPIAESALLSGPLEPTNEPYALAKIAGIKLCESYNRQYHTDFRSVMPTNLYGPGDNFHPRNSHVLPALLRRFHEARENHDAEVLVWGSGKPKREFLHVDDMAAACLHVMELPKSTYDEHTEPMLSHINVGTGSDCTIKALAGIIADTVGFEGDISFDSSQPDGTSRKLLDVDKLSQLGWRASIELADGIATTYQWFLQNNAKLRS